MRASTGLVSTLSNHLSSISCNSSQFSPTSIFRFCLHNQQSVPQLTEYSSTNDRVRHPLGSGLYYRIYPQPHNTANTMMETYPTASDLPANLRASGDASAIATVSGINNFFYFILFFFISSFLVPDGNSNEWRRPGVSSPPTPYPTINPSSKAEQNIVHLLPFLSVPVPFVARPASLPLPLSQSSCVPISDVPVVLYLRRCNRTPPISIPELVYNSHITLHLRRLCCHFPTYMMWSSSYCLLLSRILQCRHFSTFVLCLSLSLLSIYLSLYSQTNSWRSNFPPPPPTSPLLIMLDAFPP